VRSLLITATSKRLKTSITETTILKITFYGYNAFIIEAAGKKIAIDPGALLLYYFRMTTLIPEREWKDISHIFVTHGDPDHYWHADRVAQASNAPVIFNKSMVREVDGKSLALGPRDKGVAFTTEFKRYFTVDVDEEIVVDDVTVKGIKTTHGPLKIRIGPISKTVTAGPDERVGWGAIGFSIKFAGITIVNLGDTLLHSEEWKQIEKPDVLMVPIGGGSIHNTMDENEAVEAVKIIQPKLVIPCHYNCPVFFIRKYNPADDMRFKNDVISAGYDCVVLKANEALDL